MEASLDSSMDSARSDPPVFLTTRKKKPTIMDAAAYLPNLTMNTSTSPTSGLTLSQKAAARSGLAHLSDVSREILREFETLDEATVLAKIEKQEKADRRKLGDYAARLETISQNISDMEKLSLARSQPQTLATPPTEEAAQYNPQKISEWKSQSNSIKENMKIIALRRAANKRYIDELASLRTEAILKQEEMKKKAARDARNQFLTEKVEKQREERKLRDMIEKKQEEEKWHKEHSQSGLSRSHQSILMDESKPHSLKTTSQSSPIPPLTSSPSPSFVVREQRNSILLNGNREALPEHERPHLRSVKIKDVLSLTHPIQTKVDTIHEEEPQMQQSQQQQPPKPSGLFANIVQQYSSQNGIELPDKVSQQQLARRYTNVFVDYLRLRVRRSRSQEKPLTLPALELKFLEAEKTQKNEAQVQKNSQRAHRRAEICDKVTNMYEAAVQRKKDTKYQLDRNPLVDGQFVDRTITKFVSEDVLHASIDSLIHES